MFIRRLDLSVDIEFYRNTFGGANTAAEGYLARAESMISAAYGECADGNMYYGFAVCAQAEYLAERGCSNEYKKISLGDFSAEYSDTDSGGMICTEAKLYIDKWGGYCRSAEAIY